MRFTCASFVGLSIACLKYLLDGRKWAGGADWVRQKASEVPNSRKVGCEDLYCLSFQLHPPGEGTDRETGGTPEQGSGE